MKILEKILSVLFPPVCGLCGKHAKSELCEECRDRYAKETFEHCEYCGKTAMNCTCCADLVYHTWTLIDGKAYIALSYYKSNPSEDRVTEKMLFHLKDRGGFAEFFADELARAVSNAFAREGFDLSEWTVTYPPRSAEKLNEKGFDQSEEVARRLAKKLGIKCEKTFVRAARGTVQKSLGAEDRLINAEESLIPIRKKIKEGGKYLILDDIITTGATIQTVAKNLYFYGAEAVFPIAIAKTANRSYKK